MKITLELLRNKRACLNQRQLFAALFPNGVEITEAICVSVANKFSWDWAAAHFLPVSLLAEYNAKRETLSYDYEAKRDAIWDDYNTKRESLLAEYVTTRATRRLECNIKFMALRAEYNAKLAELWAEYDIKRAALFGLLAETV